MSMTRNACPRFLCIVEKTTHKSGWVAWEIGKAVEMNRKIVAVKTDRSNTTPTGLLMVGASWALSFNLEAIRKALV